MKKTLVFFLTLMALLSLAACGGGDATADSGSGGTSAASGDTSGTGGDTSETGVDTSISLFDEDYDFTEDLSDYADSVNKNNLTAAQIAAIEAAAAEQGYEVKWESDGSLTIVFEDSSFSTSGKWPDNEFANLLPAPRAGTVAAVEVTETDCTIAMSMTLDEAKDYASDVKASGFDINADEQDMSSMNVYMYTAENSDGVTVTVSCMSGITGIVIEK